MASSTSLSFKVIRRTPELITPAKPTPQEYKLLSDIDGQVNLRMQMPLLFFYRKNPSSSGSVKDPVKVIRDAIAKALVFYYTLAGRLREGPGRKLGVDCTGEGVVFIEADADVRIEEFGETIQLPFPEELLYDVPGSQGIFNCPLLLIQVTRMLCGGFVFGLRLNHTMCDAIGLAQFMKVIADFARGKSSPSIIPVWQRELPNAGGPPPRMISTHHEDDKVPDFASIPLDDDVTLRCFFFGHAEITTRRSHFPTIDHRKPSTTFEILTACLWRCRTVTIQPDPKEEVSVLFTASTKFLFPAGYYGNAVTYTAAASPAGKLYLSHALELVRSAKGGITESMRSLVDQIASGASGAQLDPRTNFWISDLTRVGFKEVDFGWGKPAYGGPAKDDFGVPAASPSFYVPVTKDKGEHGILVPIRLPGPAMKLFEVELQKLLKSSQPKTGFTTSMTKSAL